MDLNLNLRLTQEQIDQLSIEVKNQLDTLIDEGKLKRIVSDTLKSTIKSIVNEMIQTKNYRSVISDAVQTCLMSALKEITSNAVDNSKCTWYKNDGECWRDMPDSKHQCVCVTCMHFEKS